jgi:hypothetical protein
MCRTIPPAAVAGEDKPESFSNRYPYLPKACNRGLFAFSMLSPDPGNLYCLSCPGLGINS